MPHRRIVKKGSFAGHLDELVRHFSSRQQEAAEQRAKQARASQRDRRNVHDRLLESALGEGPRRGS